MKHAGPYACSPCRFALAIIVLAAVSLSGTALAGESPSIANFLKIRWPSSGSLAADGTFYYVYDPEGVYQLFCRRPAESSEQSKGEQLTSFEDGIQGYSLSRDGKWITVSAGEGGDEQSDLYLIEVAKGSLEPLFIDRETVFGSVTWRRDSKAFAYRANLENKSDFHVYLYDLQKRESRRVLDRAGHYAPVDFNRDGSKLAVMKYNSSTYSQLFEIDLATGEVRELTSAGEEWYFAPIGYTQDDARFLVSTDYRGDLRNLRAIDLKTSAIKPLTPELDKFECDGAGFNEDRSILAILLNEDGYRTLHLRRMPSLDPLPTPPMDKGIVGNIDFTGPVMLYSLQNARTPGIIYQWSLATPDKAPVALTAADTQGIDVSKFPLPELIRYDSFDGLSVPAFLYTPPGYEKGKPIPFICHYHGGPESQYRPFFDRRYQYFLSRGYGVIAPNVRGSSGYGKKFLEMDNYRLRMDSVMDGVWAARWLIKNNYAERGKIAAFGGSYGGFMVVAVITQAPALFGAACDVVGIVNFKTFLERTKDYRRKLREAEYGPLDDPDFLESISPLRLVKKIRTPVLIAHGKNDPRVPFHEAEQLYQALRDLERPVELVAFDDEGHGFRKEKNRIEFYEKVAVFFDKYLKERSAEASQ